jgi:P-type Mg2+ transporter
MSELRSLPARARVGANRHNTPDPFWASDVKHLVDALGSAATGLSSAEAAARLDRIGPNRLQTHGGRSRGAVLAGQLKSPLLLLLVFATIASLLSGELVDATIVIVIVVASVGLGYWREFHAETAAAALQARIRTRTTALRDGVACKVPLDEIVPGDVVLLSAGSLVPADGVLLEAIDFFVNEAVLTGESFPVEKHAGMVRADAVVRDRTNSVFLGTNVRSGSGRCLIVRTGPATEFGRVAARLASKAPITDFEKGLRRFGYLLTIGMLCMILVVFATHALRGRPTVSTLLFSIALAVGLSPELLPAILAINLSRGAQMLAGHGVLVRRLSAIENLGSIDVLCADKTGTLTEGVVQLEGAYGPDGAPSDVVMDLAALNATLQTGLANPLDEAILATRTLDVSNLRKLAEVPFDFVRKRVSVVLASADSVTLVTKGAFLAVLDACTKLPDGSALSDSTRDALVARYDAWSAIGTRVLAVARRTIDRKPGYSRDDERDLVFAGFLTFVDRPKEDARKALADLASLGVSVKIITGDSKEVERYVASLVGLQNARAVTGHEMRTVHDEALWRIAGETDLFVEVDPDQKERIILALKHAGHVVGFLGDGVNDAPAMHVADTSLSVDQAVDVAREAADFVLLEHDLDVIRRGIEEGRRTFANTMKYILTTTSANLGNMLSMAGASLVLPFLPLLPGQILLNNFLSDIPAVGIADDSVDREMVARPRRWDIRVIGLFALEFGVISSAFDVITFAVLLIVFRAAPETFRTAWFIESLLTELVIALVVRTRRPFFRSRPGRLLLWSTVILIGFTFLVPVLPGARLAGFVPLPATMLAVLCAITAAYVGATELAKRRFYLAGQR